MRGAVEAVKEFTEKGRGIVCPGIPQRMSMGQMDFMFAKILGEMREMMVPDEKKEDPILRLMRLVVKSETPKKKSVDFDSDQEVIAEQLDGAIDIIVYILDSMNMVAQNVDKGIKAVTDENLNKKFPDGQFHVDKDGKIDKPPGFVPADMKAIVADMELNGSWTY